MSATPSLDAIEERARKYVGTERYSNSIDAKLIGDLAKDVVDLCTRLRAASSAGGLKNYEFTSDGRPVVDIEFYGSPPETG